MIGFLLGFVTAVALMISTTKMRVMASSPQRATQITMGTCCSLYGCFRAWSSQKKPLKARFKCKYIACDVLNVVGLPLKRLGWSVMVENVDVGHGEGEDEEAEDLKAGLSADLETGWPALPGLHGVCTVHGDG